MSASENELGMLHAAVATALAEKISTGEYSASDISNAIKFLKDNNITCAPGEDNAVGALAAALGKAKGVSPVDQQDLASALENMEFTTRAN